MAFFSVVLLKFCTFQRKNVLLGHCSTITTWGREGEKEAFTNMLTHFPKGIVSIVSDSYDIWNACENVWGQQLKSLVEKRDGTLVVRPDSGEPTEVVIKVTKVLFLIGRKMIAKKIKVLKVLKQGDNLIYSAKSEGHADAV